tara:strand:- start:80 stop:889 length:810 start_codon:yes stop_codon:yes gene_type:complete
MSKYRKLPKLKKGEGRMYSVRLNLGDNYSKPYGIQRKIWTMSFDERGAFWTRLLRAKNRTDAVNRMLIWYRNKKHKANKSGVGLFANLPQYVDEAVEIADDFSEVVFYSTMRPSQLKNRLLTPDKLDEIIKLSKGAFVKTSDFSKQGCFTQTKEYARRREQARMVKIPDVPYVYKHNYTNRYHAKIQIRSKKSDGGYMKYLGCEKRNDGKGTWSRVFWEHKRGKQVQAARFTIVTLKATNLQDAVKEAVALRSKQERGQCGNAKHFNKK